ncbi:MAG TPA: hypothetical protein VMD31_00870 [Opitutaceae bacterium]|nr:hypothetical protein [Opitutaceae bacterium]
MNWQFDASVQTFRLPAVVRRTRRGPALNDGARKIPTTLPVTRGLRELRGAVDRAAAGGALAPPGGQRIRELEELGDTLDTVEFAARLVGAEPGGAFCTCRRIGDTLWAFAGLVEVSDRLQQAAVASAARGYLEDALARMAPEAAAAEVAAVLPLTGWSCLAWPLAGGAPRRWTGKGRRLAAPSTAVDVAGPICLHTFGTDCQRTVDLGIGGFEDLPAAEVAENLCRLLGEPARGALIVVRYAAAGEGPPAPPGA